MGYTEDDNVKKINPSIKAVAATTDTTYTTDPPVAQHSMVSIKDKITSEIILKLEYYAKRTQDSVKQIKSHIEPFYQIVFDNIRYTDDDYVTKINPPMKAVVDTTSGDTPPSDTPPGDTPPGDTPPENIILNKLFAGGMEQKGGNQLDGDSANHKYNLIQKIKESLGETLTYLGLGATKEEIKERASLIRTYYTKNKIQYDGFRGSDNDKRLVRDIHGKPTLIDIEKDRKIDPTLANIIHGEINSPITVTSNPSNGGSQIDAEDSAKVATITYTDDNPNADNPNQPNTYEPNTYQPKQGLYESRSYKKNIASE
jgi:hypothetical protein